MKNLSRLVVIFVVFACIRENTCLNPEMVTAIIQNGDKVAVCTDEYLEECHISDYGFNTTRELLRREGDLR